MQTENQLREPKFEFALKGPGRAQILLVGNGVERRPGGWKDENQSGKELSWEELLMALMVEDQMKLNDEDPDLIQTDEQKRKRMQQLENIPFPLRYQLLTTSRSAEYPLKPETRKEREKMLRETCQELGAVLTPVLQRLPKLGADHILSTNYAYSMERAFLEQEKIRRLNKPFLDWFRKSENRSRLRFNRNPEKGSGEKQKLETVYRLHSGYTARNADGSPVGLWHIHGECTVSNGIILGHDGYGRLLKRIVECCEGKRLFPEAKLLEQENPKLTMNSWPALFLFADVYVLGFGMDLSEFDLWWLLRRKQQERYGRGRVYFFDNGDRKCDRERNLLLKAHGVLVNDGVKIIPPRDDNGQHAVFYANALERIEALIRTNRAAAAK